MMTQAKRRHHHHAVASQWNVSPLPTQAQSPLKAETTSRIVRRLKMVTTSRTSTVWMQTLLQLVLRPVAVRRVWAAAQVVVLQDSASGVVAAGAVDRLAAVAVPIADRSKQIQ